MDYKYIVATRCFTYNQAPYILDTLRGFSIQKTSFPCVFIIVDDASSDGEPDILRHWAEENLLLNEKRVSSCKEMQYGELIYARHKEQTNSFYSIILLSDNHYRSQKSKQKMSYIAEWYNESKYHAICEGDDFWIHPQKLQLQVDFLEAKSGYGLVHTKSKVLIESKHEYEKTLRGERVDSFENFIEANTIVTATTLFSKEIDNAYLDDVPSQRTWPLLDLSRWLYFYLHSKVGFIDEITTVYRVLDESASHSTDFEKKLLFYNTSADVCRYYIEQSGRKNLWRRFKKKYLRLITRHYYLYGKKVEWNAIVDFFCFDLKSYTYIIASYLLPKHGNKE